MTGLWQSLDRIRKFYGRLLKVSFCEITKQITFETLIPDPDIRNDIQNSKVVSISLKNNSNKVKIVDKFGKPAEIIFHKAIADENDNVGDIRLEKFATDNEDKTSDTDDILHLDDDNEDVLEIIFSSGMPAE